MSWITKILRGKKETKTVVMTEPTDQKHVSMSTNRNATLCRKDTPECPICKRSFISSGVSIGGIISIMVPSCKCGVDYSSFSGYTTNSDTTANLLRERGYQVSWGAPNKFDTDERYLIADSDGNR